MLLSRLMLKRRKLTFSASRPTFKSLALLLLTVAALIGQDSTSYLTPDVSRVGERLACRCGGCRNTVGNCPMIRCSSADPKRQRIHQMKQAGMSDDAVVNTFVREEGIVALSAPPSGSWGGFITWVMPGVVLLLGFFVYLRYVKGKQQAPAPFTDKDEALLERYKSHMDLD